MIERMVWGRKLGAQIGRGRWRIYALRRLCHLLFTLRLLDDEEARLQVRSQVRLYADDYKLNSFLCCL